VTLIVSLNASSQTTFASDLVPSDLQYSHGKLCIPPLSGAELEETLSELKKVNGKYIPTGSQGSEIIDALVCKYHGTDRFGQRRYSVKVDKVYLGDLVQGSVINMRTPKDGGEVLTVGKRYRILACDFNKLLTKRRSPKYFFWKGTVLDL